MASVEEYAAWRHISPQRVREMLRDGLIPGTRIGDRQWIVDEAAFAARKPQRHPLGPVVAWALIALLSGEEPGPEVSAVQAHRARKYRNELVHSSDPASLMHDLLRHRGERLVFRGAQPDIDELVGDERIVLSGISDPRSGLASSGSAELWLRDWNDLSAFVGDWLLLPDPSGNVVIHRGSDRLERVERAPIGLVAADLADWNSPREDLRAADLVKSAL